MDGTGDKNKTNQTERVKSPTRVTRPSPIQPPSPGVNEVKNYTPVSSCTIQLRKAAVQFTAASGPLYAKSVNHRHWYRVRGITKTLASVTCNYKQISGYNMIVMDLLAKITKDLTANPNSSLDWVPEYAVNLNMQRDKGLALRESLLRAHGLGDLNLETCRRIWDKHGLSSCIGRTVDAQCKAVFNGKSSLDAAGPVARLVVTQLAALHLKPVCGGLRVAAIPNPDVDSQVQGTYTYHNRCTLGCTGIRDGWGFYTEVDLVAHDTERNETVIIELKTRNNDTLDRATLWRYNLQLWLTWVMFSLTYPSMAERSAAYLVIIRPGTNRVTVRSCFKPTLSKTLRGKFPWLCCFCPQVLNCLTPNCFHSRVKVAASRRPVRPDPMDLCYRNHMFEKEKFQRLAESEGAAKLSNESLNSL